MKRVATRAALAVVMLVVWPTSAAASGQVIVKYRKGASAGKRRASARAVGDARVVGSVRGQGTRVLAVDGDPAAAAARLDAAPGVSWAEPDYPLRSLVEPNDPLIGKLGGLGLMHASVAWDSLGLSGSWPSSGGVPVGIVDSG